MNYAQARRDVSIWFAMGLIVLVVGSAARAAAPDDTASSAATPPKKAAPQKKPTFEELERRIQILEQKLEAQQQATATELQRFISVLIYVYDAGTTERPALGTIGSWWH